MRTNCPIEFRNLTHDIKTFEFEVLIRAGKEGISRNYYSSLSGSREECIHFALSLQRGGFSQFIHVNARREDEFGYDTIVKLIVQEGLQNLYSESKT